MTRLNRLPVTEHPYFGEFWNRYTNSFNSLSEKLDHAGIEITELNEVIEAVQDVERLSFWQSIREIVFRLGGVA